MNMSNETKEIAKNSGAGGFGFCVLYLLFNIQTGISDLNKAVADNDSRLDVVEYRLNDKS